MNSPLATHRRQAGRQQSWGAREGGRPPRSPAGPPPTRRSPRRVKGRSRRPQWLPGLLLVLPSLIAVGLFVYGFMGWNVRVSMTSWRGLRPTYDWVGLRNFINLWQDERWLLDVRNVLIFTSVFVGGSLALGFVMALLLDRGVKGEAFFRGVFLFPMAISFVATAIVWRWLLDNGTGQDTAGLNRLFEAIGLGFLRSDWHRSEGGWAIAAVALPAGWALSGYVMALFLAGLRTIPESTREAARIDGASERQIFWHVTRPQLRPVTVAAVVILAHISLKTFDLLYAIDQRSIKIDTPSLYMWFTTFDGGFYNRGATIATVLLIGVALVIVPYIRNALRRNRT
jgi:glucose/mannose transport system permease protein